MAREVNAMISYGDMDDMVTLDGFKYQLFPSGGEGNLLAMANKSQIENYLVVTINGSYASNQLVPYNNVLRGLSCFPAQLNFTEFAGSSDFDVYTPNAWTASEGVSWLSISPTSGTGDTTITATVIKNTGGLRSTTVTITDTVTAAVVNYTIEQAAFTAIPTDPVTLVIIQSTSALACSGYPSSAVTAYIPEGEVFATCTVIYLSSNGSTIGAAGWYSDGTIARNWNGSNAFIGGNVSC